MESSMGDINCGITATSSVSIGVDVWPGPSTTFGNAN
jgi:hypothetical protein